MEDDRAALACGDGNDRSTQSLGIQLAPHTPAADVYLERHARRSRRRGDTGEPLGIEDEATKAVAASPSSAQAHYAKASVLRVQRRCAEAIPEYEAALAINRNWVKALAAIGRCKIYIGPIEKGIVAQEHAIRLSPRDPSIWNWYFRIGEGHLLQSQIDDAILKGLMQPVSAFNVPLAACQPALRVIEGGPQSV